MTSSRVMLLKAILFLILGAIAAVWLFAAQPHGTTAVLIAILAWASARLYYFAFYVVTAYVDPTYRFSGIVAALLHTARHRRGNRSELPSRLTPS